MLKYIAGLRISLSLMVLLWTGLVFGPGNAQATICLPASDPLAWWGFDGDFQDLGGNCHDGVLYGQVGFDDNGICFSAGSFPGSPNYLQTADDPVLTSNLGHPFFTNFKVKGIGIDLLNKTKLWLSMTQYYQYDKKLPF